MRNICQNVANLETFRLNRMLKDGIRYYATSRRQTRLEGIPKGFPQRISVAGESPYKWTHVLAIWWIKKCPLPQIIKSIWLVLICHTTDVRWEKHKSLCRQLYACYHTKNIHLSPPYTQKSYIPSHDMFVTDIRVTGNVTFTLFFIYQIWQ